MSGYDLQHMPPLDRLLVHARQSQLFSRADGDLAMARAPGRLDVMGGIADYTGSVVCEMSLAMATGAVAQLRSDGRIVCHSVQFGRTAVTDVAAISNADPGVVADRMTGEDTWARYPVGCIWWLLEHRAVASLSLQRGVTILIDSDVPLSAGVSSSAAIEVAVMMALSRLAGIDFDPVELAAACQNVENHVVGAPCGIMDQVTSVLGREHRLLKLLCQPQQSGSVPAQPLGYVSVPEGFAFLGIHSGVTHDVSGDPYTDTRVAAFMGQKILSVEVTPEPTGGWLANVDRGRFDDEWVDLLPAAMTGQAFLDRYGNTNDTAAAVRPGRMYAVRRATLHHVHESGRVAKFIAAIEASDMATAGRLMIESHHSYGDNAQLGHRHTDTLLDLAMRIGQPGGIFGGRITGGGCGGTVALLVRDQPAVHARIGHVREQYTAQTGLPTTLIHGSGPGAAETGAATIRSEVLP